MGKYLQDIRFDIETDGKTITEYQRQTISKCNLIEVLFNLYLPQKFIAGDQVWRVHIQLTSDKSKDLYLNNLGCLQCFLYFDEVQLNKLDPPEQKKLLLTLLFEGLKFSIKCNPSDWESILKIQDKILKDNFLYNDYFKDRKKSPDKKLSAQMKGFYSEIYADRKLYISIFDQNNQEIKSILVGQFNFQAFDRIKWIDHKTIFVYHINNIQSYKSKRVAEDYFSIDIESVNVIYQPVTKESMFDYGVQLLTESDEYDKAMEYLLKVRTMGHGKVENILRNLEINPHLRDKSILLQVPSKRSK